MAKVYISTSAGKEMIGLTDGAGQITFDQLPPGIYMLFAKGYAADISKYVEGNATV